MPASVSNLSIFQHFNVSEVTRQCFCLIASRLTMDNKKTGWETCAQACCFHSRLAC